MAALVKHRYFMKFFKFKGVKCQVIGTSEKGIRFKWIPEPPHEHRFVNGFNMLTFNYIRQHNICIH